MAMSVGAMKQQIVIFAMAVGILGRSFLRGSGLYAGPGITTQTPLAAVTVTTASSASVWKGSGPMSIDPRINTTVKVYLYPERSLKSNPAQSIFKTDVLQRYGSGRLQFLVYELGTRLHYNRCSRACDALNRKRQEEKSNNRNPCLAVTREAGNCRHNQLKCAHPHCKTMVTNDELCVADWYDARQYYSSRIPNAAYLPLGPRIEAWSSFRKIWGNPQYSVIPASRRKFSINAMFSRSTGDERMVLAEIVESLMIESTNLTMYASMPNLWEIKIANDLDDDTLSTDDYVQVLLDSIFTLSPAGKSPECFRLFEAAEAGSIPIMVRSDLFLRTNRRTRCRKAMLHWFDAPIVLLDSWNDLFPTVARLVEDLDALDEMQTRLRSWYDDFMHKAVEDFENSLMPPVNSEFGEYYEDLPSDRRPLPF